MQTRRRGRSRRTDSSKKQLASIAADKENVRAPGIGDDGVGMNHEPHKSVESDAQADDGDELSSVPTGESASHVLGNASSLHERESRFASFIKPLRELAENWQIDVAHEIEVYIEELHALHEEHQDAGEGTFNFASAALFLQGSTCVYSRKVRLVHLP